MGFGTVLRTLRAETGLTQEELADRSGLSVRAIRNLESGRTARPQRQSVVLLATALGLPEQDRATLLAAAGRSAPLLPGRCELPPDVPELFARDAVTSALTRLLTTDGPRLAVLTGGPGVGRTALAVRVAHRVRDHFPDGQIFADLARPDGTPMPVEDVLARVLRSLGHAEPPPTRDEAAALARAELTARRVLLVLDNVAAEAQVRPLLTGGSHSAVLLTSRRKLVALPGAHTVRLEPFGLDCALVMLSRLIGVRAVQRDPASAKAVATACSCLPLALHIAGTWLATHPHRTLADLAGRLTEHGLDQLVLADLSMRASIAAHVGELRPDDRQLLRGLSRIDETGRSLNHSDHDAMARLALANLLTPTRDGYRLDPLIRHYAQEDDGLPRLRAAR